MRDMREVAEQGDPFQPGSLSLEVGNEPQRSSSNWTSPGSGGLILASVYGVRALNRGGTATICPRPGLSHRNRNVGEPRDSPLAVLMVVDEARMASPPPPASLSTGRRRRATDPQDRGAPVTAR